MSRRLLLTLMISAMACMGSECSSSSSSGSAGANATSSAATGLEKEQIDGLAPVPEPSAALIFGLGLLAAGIATRRKS